MISYEPLWQTMKLREATTYTLQVKGGISSSTIRRIKAGDSISTHSIDALCHVLHCRVQDVIEYVEDAPKPNDLQASKQV